MISTEDMLARIDILNQGLKNWTKNTWLESLEDTDSERCEHNNCTCSLSTHQTGRAEVSNHAVDEGLSVRCVGPGITTTNYTETIFYHKEEPNYHEKGTGITTTINTKIFCTIMQIFLSRGGPR